MMMTLLEIFIDMKKNDFIAPGGNIGCSFRIIFILLELVTEVEDVGVLLCLNHDHVVYFELVRQEKAATDS